MCTVTFIPINDNYYITSNRDEKPSRKIAIPPTFCANLICPIDPDAGGTWIAVHENGNAAVLLNGAVERHIPNPPYERSRGVILLSIINHDTPVEKFIRVDLTRIEPFTVVIIEEGNLYKCQWDGKMKYYVKLQNDKAHIWSSVTLYDEKTASMREKWFLDFLSEHPSPTQEKIFEFHRFAGGGDPKNNLQMRRGDLFSTVSITSMSLTPTFSNMKYFDLQSGERHQQGFRVHKLIKSR